MKRINFYSSYDKSQGGVILNWWVQPVIIVFVIIFATIVYAVKSHGAVDKSIPKVDIEETYENLAYQVQIEEILIEVRKLHPEWFNGNSPNK